MPKPVETIKSRELLIITDTSSRNKPGAGYKMRVVQYYKDGKNISVKLAHYTLISRMKRL